MVRLVTPLPLTVVALIQFLLRSEPVPEVQPFQPNFLSTVSYDPRVWL